MKATTVVALGVGILIVVGIGTKIAVKGNGDGVPDVEVKLTLDTAGVCQPSNPGLLGGTYDDVVTWRVTNINCADQFIGVTNFRAYNKDGTRDKLDKKVIDRDPAIGGPVSKTDTEPFRLTAQIKKWQWFKKKKFYYEIWLGTTTTNLVMRLDPDIEIWP